jgi:hypothetical protein
MRTTLRIDDDLLAKAKRLAAESGRTLTAVVEDALREVVARRSRRKHRSPVRLPTFKGNGILPGADLDDSASLLDLMDSRHDSA